MPQDLPVGDSAELTIRHDKNVLLGTWHRPVASADLQRGYEALLTAARQQAARFWLLDLRLRGVSSEDDTLWVLEDFLPRLLPALGGPVFIAFLIPEAQLSTAGDPADGELMAATPSYHVRLFASEKAAGAWLARRRQHETV